MIAYVRFVAIFHAAVIFWCVCGDTPATAEEAKRGNILLITVDDMSCDSVGAFGCKLEDTTPNIDQFARQGLRFDHAFVQVGNCMPCRNVMMSGRYPHNNGVEGFRPFPGADYPILVDLMKEAGYFTAIFGKVEHSSPYKPYAWDAVLDEVGGRKLHKKNPKDYFSATQAGLAAAKNASKPFCLVVNISDPHKPFYRGGDTKVDPVPSRVYQNDEVPIPGFLFDHPTVRKELAQYYSTVRRADDCFAQVMKALNETDQAANTLVIFLSDHGMPLPFAKTQIYYHSLHTPLIVRWPGVTKPGSVDQTHFVSVVDLLPTLLDVAGVQHPEGLDGRSFAAVIKGEQQPSRDHVIGEYNENAALIRHPMRTVIGRRFGYIYNPWANGKRQFRTATQGTATYQLMKELAPSNEEIAARLELFDHRVSEEFYDYQQDPDALHNLIDDPEYQDEIERHRKLLLNWMRRTGDHCLAAFANRENAAAVENYMSTQEAQSERNRQERRKKKQRG